MPSFKWKIEFISVFLLLVCLPAIAQKSEKFYDYRWNECQPNMARFYSLMVETDSGYIRNDYFIHEKSIQMSGKFEDSQCKVKNGYFHFFHPNGVIESMGKYVHGEKDGLWLSYHENGMMQDSTQYDHGSVIGTSLSWYANGYLQDSTYLNDDGSGLRIGWFDNGSPSLAGILASGEKPHGKWTFYHKNGQISAFETYSNGRLIDKKYFNEQGVEETDTTSKDRDAEFPGGNKAWQHYIRKKLYFPPNYNIVNSDSAIVVVDFVISEEGDVEHVYVSTPFFPAFDKIAQNAILNSPKWVPAIRHNRKIKAYRKQSVTFSQYD